MANYKSIEDYRAKKKRKSFFKKAIILILIFGILILLLNVLQVFKGSDLNEIIKNDSQSETDAFPLTIKNEQILNIYNLGSNISILTKANILTYSENGKKVSQLSHGYTNPVVKEGNKRLLTYDRGGNKFRVDTSSSKALEKELTSQIIFAQISNNGNVAVITNDDRYACIITVYDSSLNEIYKYSATERISSVCFSPDKHFILASAITTDAGIISSTLYELNITEDVDAVKYSVQGILPLEVSYSQNSNIKVIGKDNLITINTKTKQQTKYEYKGDIQHYINSSTNETVIVSKNLFNNFSSVTVINSSGTLKHTYNIQDDVLDLYSDGSRILLLSKKSAYNFDMSLLLLNKIELSKSLNKIGYNGENLYIMGSDCVEKYKIG